MPVSNPLNLLRGRSISIVSTDATVMRGKTISISSTGPDDATESILIRAEHQFGGIQINGTAFVGIDTDSAFINGTSSMDFTGGALAFIADTSLDFLNAGGSVSIGAGGAAGNIRLNVAGIGVILLGTQLGNFANDAAAAAGGIPVRGLYRNGSVVMTRVV